MLGELRRGELNEVDLELKSRNVAPKLHLLTAYPKAGMLVFQFCFGHGGLPLCVFR